MTPIAVRAGLLTFAVLTGAFTTNIFVFQPPPRQLAGVDSVRGGSAGAAVDTANGWSSERETPIRDAVVQPIETGAVKPLADAVDRADLTRAIQRELKAKGYEAGAVDGVAGLVTRGAIMAYETDAGLPLSGEPSPELLQHIVLGSGDIRAASDDARTLPGPEAEAVIRAVQRAFRQLGYLTTLPDGRLNDETRRAIRKFEIERKLTETGRISGELLAKLASLASDALR